MTVNRLSLMAMTLCLAISGCSSAITATRDKPYPGRPRHAHLRQQDR
jgi:uncharacterized protein YceK